MEVFKVLRRLLFVGLFLTSGSAFANNVYIGIDCSSVKFYFANWPAGKPYSSQITVKVDGNTVSSHTFSFTGPGGTDTVPLTFTTPGSHVIAATAVYTDVYTKQPVTGAATKTVSGCPVVCIPGSPNPAGAHASGEAFGLDATLPLLPPIAAVPEVASLQNGVGTSTEADQISLPAVPGVLDAVLLGVSSTGTIQTIADDTSSSETANLNLLNGLIKADVVRASVEAIAAGDYSAVSDAGTTFANLVVAGVPYANVAPNTKIALPVLGLGAYVILRETVKTTSAPAAGVLSGGVYSGDVTVNMIHVVVPPLLLVPGTEIIVAHAESHADFPQTKICSSSPAHSVSGDAGTAIVNLTNPTLLTTVDYVTLPSAGGGPFTANGASSTLPATLGTTGAGLSSTQGSLGSTTTAQSSNQVSGVNLLGGQITATLVQTGASSSVTSSTRSSTPSFTLADLNVLGVPVAANVAPNSTITLPGIGYLVINEQIPDGTAPGHSGITVRALHLHVNSLAGITPGTDVIVSESRSGATY